MRLIINGVPPGECERDTNKMIWSSFLGNGITEQKKKSTVAKLLLLRMPLCFSFFVPSSRSKVSSWSVDIEPTLKSVLNNTVDNETCTLTFSHSIFWIKAESVVFPLKILQNSVLVFFSKRSVMAEKFRIVRLVLSLSHPYKFYICTLKDVVSCSGPFWKLISKFFFITKYNTIVSIFLYVFISIINYKNFIFLLYLMQFCTGFFKPK